MSYFLFYSPVSGAHCGASCRTGHPVVTCATCDWCTLLQVSWLTLFILLHCCMCQVPRSKQKYFYWSLSGCLDVRDQRFDHQKMWLYFNINKWLFCPVLQGGL